jgi:CO/xanthine dehydrogenase Mo-binding subunit
VCFSPHAHARIVKVDTSKAEKLPGVAAVLTREDLISDHIDPYFGLIIQDQTPVALDTVRFVGEAVAASLPSTRIRRPKQSSSLSVEYEELPAVFDPEEALKPGRRFCTRTEAHHSRAPGCGRGRDESDLTVVHLFKQRKGDMARGFRDSDRIFENTFFSPSVNHLALEPHVTVAQVSGGRITVWTCNQNPHVVQRQLAGIFKVPIADVRVIVFTLGGGFGGKLNSKLEPAAVLLAKKTGRPVRMVARRAECFLLGVQHECKVKLKTGVKADGTLVAVEAHCYYNSGAYGDTTPNLITRGYAATGPYLVPHLHIDSDRV